MTGCRMMVQTPTDTTTVPRPISAALPNVGFTNQSCVRDRFLFGVARAGGEAAPWRSLVNRFCTTACFPKRWETGGARRHCSAILAASLSTSSRPSSRLGVKLGVVAVAAAELALCNRDALFTQTGLAA